jgi:glutathione S-transferase
MAEAVLWHIEISPANEKARWALDYKGVPHERRAPPPGLHMAVALWVTRGGGKTFPALKLDGQRIGDSTAIIEALEWRYPEPPLYPEDSEDRRRALELEDFFDEEVFPHLRLLVWHEATKDRDAFDRAVATVLPDAVRDRGARVAGAFLARFVRARYGVAGHRVADPEAAELAKRRVESGLDRLESELGDREYLVGDRFSVADLAGAATLYPLFRPPEGPRIPFAYPEGLQRFCDSVADRPAIEWAREMFRRHRGTSAATLSTGLAAARA